MTTWRYSVSWSKFKLALLCPLQLQYTIDKKPHGRSDINYYMVLGKLVQLAFELYFNQKINLKDGGRSPKTIEKLADKLLSSNWIASQNVTYPTGKTEDDLKTQARDQIIKGFAIMERLKLTHYPVRSEVKWNAVFRGFRMFCMIDFLREGRKGCWVFDGKGHSRMNADPMQVVYYALAVAAAGRDVAGGGLIYWQHDTYVPVDVSPKALRDFIDGPFAEGRAIFEELKDGVQTLPAKPSRSTCGDCSWKNNCPVSAVKLPPMQEGLPETLGFGELSPPV